MGQLAASTVKMTAPLEDYECQQHTLRQKLLHANNISQLGLAGLLAQPVDPGHLAATCSPLTRRCPGDASEGP